MSESIRNLWGQWKGTREMCCRDPQSSRRSREELRGDGKGSREQRGVTGHRGREKGLGVIG